jgi:hypothetical protein
MGAGKVLVQTYCYRIVPQFRNANYTMTGALIMGFFRRWKRASKTTKVAIVGSAAGSLFFFAAGILFLLIAYDPVKFGLKNPVLGNELIAYFVQNPNPLIRIPAAGAFATFAIAVAGLMFWSTNQLFNLDRWKPPIEDRTRVSNVGDR